MVTVGDYREGAITREGIEYCAEGGVGYQKRDKRAHGLEGVRAGVTIVHIMIGEGEDCLVVLHSSSTFRVNFRSTFTI